MNKKQKQPYGPASSGISDKGNAIIAGFASQGGASNIGFSLGFRDPDTGNLIVHFEQLPAGDAVNLGAQTWVRAIDLELAQHPEYDVKYQKFFRDAVKEFVETISKLNKKALAFKAKK